MTMALRYRGGGGVSAPVNQFANCRWRITLEDNTASFFETGFIRGTLRFFKPRPQYTAGDLIELKSLRIQLEGTAKASFQLRVDSRINNESDEGPFIQPMMADDPQNPSSAPFVVHFIRNYLPTHPKYVSKGTAEHSFPFEMELENFPATLSTPFGQIEYKLAVYANGQFCEDKIVSSMPAFMHGSLNLVSSVLGEPITVPNQSGGGGRSFLCSKQPNKLQANLTLNQRGYLADELILFRIQMDNPVAETIEKVEVSLVHQIVYYANFINKQTSTVLDQKKWTMEEGSLGSPNGATELAWEEVLTIPSKLMPSFPRNSNSNSRRSIEILYFVKFEVVVSDRRELKGKTVVVMGTKRDGKMARDDPTSTSGWSGSIPELTVGLLEPTTSGCGSAASTSSRTSGPPAYKLYASQPSLDTLPPTYEDAMCYSDPNLLNAMNIESRGHRRCNSNVL